MRDVSSQVRACVQTVREIADVDACSNVGVVLM